MDNEHWFEVNCGWLRLDRDESFTVRCGGTSSARPPR